MPTRGKLQPKIIICFVLLLFCFVGGVFCLVSPPAKQVATTFETSGVTPLQSINSGNVITQTFIPDNDYDKFGLYFANYNKYIEEGKLYITILDDEGATTDFVYDLDSLFNSSYVYIDYPLHLGHLYSLEITTNASEEQSFTFFTTNKTPQMDAELTIDGEKQDTIMIMTFVSTAKDYFSIWYFAAAATIVICYMVLNTKKEFYVKK